MLKRAIFIATMLLATSNMLCDDWAPYFPDGTNYIKLGAANRLCGGVTITPTRQTGQVKLESYVFYSPFGSTDFTTDGQIGTYGDTDGLEAGGHRFRYDWAGAGPKTHYRIFCKVRNTKLDYWQDVNCWQVVSLNAIRHNKSCGIGDWITGPGVDPSGYDGLNMNKG